MKSKQDIKINYITRGSIKTASTRMRVIKLSKILKQKGYKISINEDIKSSDIIILQKSYPISFLFQKFIECRLANKYIVFDIDDFFPEFLPFVKYSDCVIASTNTLKDVLVHLNSNIFVVENPIDILKERDLKTQFSEEIKVCWHGFHVNSYILEKKKINDVTIISDKGDILWNEDTIDENIQKFDLCVIPQEKNIHTLCKTHCRMLKCLYLGVPVLVSDMPEYIELAKIVHYPKEFILKDTDDWNETIKKIKNNQLKLSFDFLQCRKILLEKFNEEVIAEKNFNTVYNNYIKNHTSASKNTLTTKLLRDFQLINNTKRQAKKYKNTYRLKYIFSFGKKREIYKQLYCFFKQQLKQSRNRAKAIQ